MPARHHLPLHSLIALATASAWAAPDPAPEPDPAPVVNRVDAVTVTGKRAQDKARAVRSVDGLEAEVVDTPRSVSQIDALQLQREPIRNADDLVRYAPGITRNGGQNVSIAPLIRGQGSELFQDGQRTYNVRHPFNTNAFEGVDIVAGPPSQVFGVGADPNLSHRADRILSQGWGPAFRGPAVDKCRSVLAL